MSFKKTCIKNVYTGFSLNIMLTGYYIQAIQLTDPLIQKTKLEVIATLLKM